jgi:putative ABC transport system ATP-binding protein
VPERQAAPRGAVEAVHVVKTFHLGGGEQLRAVDDVTLSVEPGSVVALTGPSGSGKSTLLHLIGAIERADGGTITVDGHLLGALSRGRLADYRRQVGFVFQRYHLLAALTALDNVMTPVLPYRTPYDKVGRAKQLLAVVGLGGRENALPSKLSGGQQQRVAIARALMGEPRLLLADEPTGNLDSTTGAEIVALLLGLRDERGMTILLATHDPQIASRADRLVRLRDGRIVDDVEVPPALPSDQLLWRISGLDAT